MHLCHSFIKLLAALIDVCKVAWDTIEAVNITLARIFEIFWVVIVWYFINQIK